MKTEYPKYQIVDVRESIAFSTKLVGHQYIIQSSPRDPGMISLKKYKGYDSCVKAAERVIKALQHKSD